MKEKTTSFFKTLGKDIVNNWCTKWIGFAIGFIAVILTIAQAGVYSGIDDRLYSAGIITFSALAIVAFFVLSVFRQT